MSYVCLCTHSEIILGTFCSSQNMLSRTVGVSSFLIINYFVGIDPIPSISIGSIPAKKERKKVDQIDRDIDR